MKDKDYIKAVRNELGLTQEEMSNRLFVSRKTVSSWETGDSIPKITMLVYKMLAEKEGIQIEE